MKKLTSGKLTGYRPGDPASPKPNKGDFIFFNQLAHVGFATGDGSRMFSFWPAPDVAFSNNADGTTKDKVKIITIEQIVDWWRVNKHSEPVVEFGRPAW
jgi:hypothetical protein